MCPVAYGALSGAMPDLPMEEAPVMPSDSGALGDGIVSYACNASASVGRVESGLAPQSGHVKQSHAVVLQPFAVPDGSGVGPCGVGCVLTKTNLC